MHLKFNFSRSRSTHAPVASSRGYSREEISKKRRGEAQFQKWCKIADYQVRTVLVPVISEKADFRKMIPSVFNSAVLHAMERFKIGRMKGMSLEDVMPRGSQRAVSARRQRFVPTLP